MRQLRESPSAIVVTACGVYGRITCQGGTMGLVGLGVTFLGFLVAASSVGIMSGNGGRLIMVLVGIGISLFGILGLINPAYRKNAVWKK